MTRSFTSLLSLSALLLALTTGCGDSASADTSPAEGATPTAPATAPPPSHVFDAAAAALNNGGSAQQVRDALMENFAQVSTPTGEIDYAAADQYLDLVEKMAEKFPGDTLVALPLYKAADLLRAEGDDLRVADIYGRIHRDYRAFSKSGEALFMQAFVYDENLKDYDTARKLYEQFLAEYPDHTFADDTEMMIKNLGKSPEEVMQGLENQ